MKGNTMSTQPPSSTSTIVLTILAALGCVVLAVVVALGIWLYIGLQSAHFG